MSSAEGLGASSTGSYLSNSAYQISLAMLASGAAGCSVADVAGCSVVVALAVSAAVFCVAVVVLPPWLLPPPQDAITRARRGMIVVFFICLLMLLSFYIIIDVRKIRIFLLLAKWRGHIFCSG